MVVFTFVAGLLSLIGTEFRSSVLAALIVLVALEAGVLFWRRRHPVVVVVASLAFALVAFAIAPQKEPGTAALVFAVYTVSAYGPARIRLVVVAVAIALLVAAVGLLLLGQFETARLFLPAGATSLVAWVTGDYLRSRRRSIAELVARHEHEREQAAEEERLRIARELHDVVAHNVSVIAINAGAARVSGSSSADALRSIEESARSTLAELNRLVGVLRKDSAAPELGPQPTLADVDTVLKAARAAGLDVALKVMGDERPLPAAVDLSGYRIVQECITNVLKHASATRVDVQLDYRADALVIVVSDNGRAARAMANTANASTGHGLIGMRERVAVFGGDLTTGYSSLGGFTVRATLPVKT